MARAPTLSRTLGLSDATLLVVGCIVGVGIFRTASPIAQQLSAPFALLALWVVGGLISLCGALSYAELAAMFPESGGDYVFISKVYNRLWGFLFGWTKLFIERTATIAILGMVFAEYIGLIIPMGEMAVRLLAVSAIVGLTAANSLGVRKGATIQNLFTILKMGALVALTVVGLTTVLSGQAVALDWTPPAVDMNLIQSFGLAFTFVLWTFGGWVEAAYVAEEVRDPTRQVPRAIVGGLLLVIVGYLFVNASYLLCLPISEIANAPLVASNVMQRAWGPAGATFIAGMIACSAFGALNGYILTGGRILFAIGRDHRLFATLGTVHPVYHTPLRALWVNAGLAIALVFMKTFDQLVTYSTVVISIFFIMTVAGLIVLRRRQPTAARPYRAWGYPVTPILFCLVMTGYVINVCFTQPAEVLFGFGLLAVGLPIYFGSKRHG